MQNERTIPGKIPNFEENGMKKLTGSRNNPLPQTTPPLLPKCPQVPNSTPPWNAYDTRPRPARPRPQRPRPHSQPPRDYPDSRSNYPAPQRPCLWPAPLFSRLLFCPCCSWQRPIGRSRRRTSWLRRLARMISPWWFSRRLRRRFLFRRWGWSGRDRRRTSLRWIR